MKEFLIDKQYDIGVYGWWGHDNFGGCLTYFALEQTLRKLNYSVLMIQEAIGLPPRYHISDDCIAMKFANKHYNCSPQVHFRNLYKFNNICDKFMVGGDQLWNNTIPFVREDNFLNFVDENKLKISYATSFGTSKHNPPPSFLDNMAPLLSRFDQVLVREKYAIDTAKRLYNVEAKQVIDAVFLLDQSDYIEAITAPSAILPKKYLFAYIFNPTFEKRRHIETIAHKLNLEIVCCPDAATAYHKLFFEVFNGIKSLSPLSIENFLYAYANASYIVTDSLHGTCMSYIFRKDFSVYYNERRGAERFTSLMDILQLDERRIFETQTPMQIMNSKFVATGIDWTNAEQNVNKEVNISLDLLKNSLEIPKSTTRIPSKFNFFKDLED